MKIMIKTTLTSGLLALALTGTVQARDIVIDEEKILVLGCLEQMEQTTSWPQCVQLMFKACEGEEVGSDAHATCLSGIRKEWVATVDILQENLMEAVTPKAKIDVLDLMGLWGNYVDQKCTQVAASKPAGAESARLGCEVSEIAGLAGEFAACLEGRSTAEYCVIEE